MTSEVMDSVRIRRTARPNKGNPELGLMGAIRALNERLSSIEKRLGQQPTKVYTVRSLKMATGISHRKIYEAINSGALVYRKDGKRTYFLAADVDGWLSSMPAGRGLWARDEKK